MSGAIARRYAKAIIAVAREESSLEETAAELQEVAVLAAEPEIAAALANPLLSASARRALARTISEQLALRPMVRNLVCLLADHRRLDQVVAIADQYRRLLDQILGQVRATITSAAPLAPSQQQTLVDTFTRLTGKKVLAEARVDSQLLGGVLVNIEGKIYDGSLRTQLHGLAERIAGGRSYL